MSKLIRHIYIGVLLISFIGLFNGCGPSAGYLLGASSYEDEEQLWNPAYRVYHTSKEKSRIYFIIPPRDILFVRNPKTRKYEAHSEIIYKIIKPVDGNNNITDSGLVEIKVEEDQIPNEAMIGYLNVKMEEGSYYYASIVLNDKKRKHQFEDILTIDKVDKRSAENFIITDSVNQVKFKNFISPGHKIKISSERIRATKFFITRYKAIDDYPYPIYVERENQKMKLKIDSTWTIASDQFVELNKRGIYHIKRDSVDIKGLTLLNFYDGFPQIAQRENLAPPMRYITSDEEFDALAVGTDASKLNTEKIWASLTTDLPRTEKLLTTYYKRVQYANIYFTSYKEGWRTDRGLVYSIFGPPSNIYKNPKEERWSYGSDGFNSSMNFEFTFVKAINPLTDNDFILIRNNNKKEVWNKAVEYWRNGKVFDEKEIQRLQEELERQNRNRNNYWYPYRSF